MTTLHDFGCVLGRPLDTIFWGSHNFMVKAFGSCMKWPLHFPSCCKKIKDCVTLSMRNDLGRHMHGWTFNGTTVFVLASIIPDNNVPSMDQTKDVVYSRASQHIMVDMKYLETYSTIGVGGVVTLVTIVPTPRGVSSPTPLLLCLVGIIPRVD